MVWLENLKLSKKLVLSFICIALLGSLLVGGTGIFGELRVNSLLNKLYKEDFSSLPPAHNAYSDILQMRINLRNMALVEDTATRSAIKTLVDGYFTDFETNMTAYAKTITPGEEQQNYEALMQDWTKNKPLMVSFMDLILAGNVAEAMKIPVSQTIIDLEKDEDSRFIFTFDYNSKNAQANILAGGSSVTVSAIGIGIAVLLSLAASVLFGRVLALVISEPLRKLSLAGERLAVGNTDIYDLLSEKDLKLKYRKDEIGALALMFNKLVSNTQKQVKSLSAIGAGDLTTEITVNSGDDKLGNAFVKLTDGMDELISTINQAAELIASQSIMLSDSSAVLSQGATEQAASVENLSSEIASISQQTKQNTQHAISANVISQSAKTGASNGNSHMQDLLKAMEDINRSSGNINKIIKVIDDIAFQTNILALNAAVEAARAGQHGKGFAVVAEEVRTLAAKSANAAKETTAMIESSIKSVANGTKLANETAVALSQIVGDVDQVAELIQTIANSSEQQSNGLELLNSSVTQISHVVQTNAAASEECAATSEELSQQADGLKKTISTFKLKSGSTMRLTGKY